MTEKFKILGQYVKDLSSETPNTETYLFVKDQILKYQLNIDITSRAVKNKIVEITTILKFEDKEPNEKKSHFEIIYITLIRINDEINEKNELEKIILCESQKKIYPDLEKTLIDLIHNSGYTNIKFEKKVDFEELYNRRFN